MPEIMKLVIAWTCVGVFVATAVITLLALVGVLKLAEKKYLDRLFKVLVAEIAVVCVAFFANWLRPPVQVQQTIETRTAERVGAETARVMQERFAPVIREYQRYVAQDGALSPAQRLERQSAAAAVQGLDARELQRFRPQPVK